MTGTRLRVAKYPGGQGRDVTLTDRTYEPMVWDETQQRVKDLLRYAPHKNVEHWLGHALMVIDLVLRTDYFDRLRDRHLAGTLHAFLSYAEDHGWSTDPASLFFGDRIDLFVTSVYAQGSWTTHRWRLRHVATVLYPPPPISQFNKRSAIQPPHSPEDRSRFLRAAATLTAGHKGELATRLRMGREVGVVLALTFGAGCYGKDVHRVRQGWLSEEPDGLWLLRPDREVPIPVGQPWADMLRAAVTGEPDAWLLRPNTANERNTQVGKVLFKARKQAPGLRGFDSDRAARRWQLDILMASGLADVAPLLGLSPQSPTLAALTEFLEPRDPALWRLRARGWSG